MPEPTDTWLLPQQPQTTPPATPTQQPTDSWLLPQQQQPDTNPYTWDTARRAPGLFAKGVAPGAIANFIAPSPDVAEKTSSLPGIITGNVSGIATLADTARKVLDLPFRSAENYVRDKIGLQPAPPLIPTAPFIKDWSNAYQGSVDRATAMMPTELQADPHNALEQAITSGGNTVGGMLGTPIPSRVISALPKLAQIPAAFVAPLATSKPLIPLAIGAVAPPAVEEAGKLIQTRLLSQNSRNRDQPPATTGGQSTTDSWLTPQTQQTPTDTWLTPQTQQTSGTQATQAESEGGDSSLTGGDIAGGTLALILAGLAAKYHARIPGLGSATERPGYIRDAAAFNDAERLRAAGDPTQTFTMQGQPAAPLAMNPVVEGARKTQAYAQDRNAVAQQFIDNIQKTDKDLSYSTGITNNSASPNTRMQAFLETGVHDATGINVPAWGRIVRDIQRLSPEEQQIMHSGLWSNTALDTRTNLFNKALSEGRIPTPEETRTQLYNTSDETLRNNVAAMENNPTTKEIADRFYGNMNGNLDIAKAYGYPTDIIEKIRRENPHYVSSADSEGQVVHIFDKRATEPYVGNEIPSTTPWEAASQHNAKLFQDMEMNALKRRIVDANMDAQIKDPTLAHMFQRKMTNTGEDVSAPHDTQSWDIMRPTGRETYHVGNSELAEAFNRNPTIASAHTIAARQLYQKGVTQAASLIGGKIFAPVEAARTAYLAPINAPRGFASGLLDKYYQRATGHNLRIMLDQPITNLGAGAMDAGNLIQHGLSKVMERNAPNPFNQFLRRIHGDAAVDSWSQAMHDRYLASPTYRMRAAGALGGTNYGYHEPTTYQTNVQGAQIRNPAADMAPGLFRANNPFTRAIMPYAVGMKKVVNEAFDVVNNMGRSSFWRLNENNPNISRDRLTYETRRLTGDMGTSGRGDVARAFTGNIPFANAATQDLAQMARTYAERPVAMPLAHIGNMGLLAAASLYTAMHTNGGLHHLFDLMSTTQRASGPVLYTDPGGDATKYAQPTFPQGARGLYPIILDLLAHGSGAWNARHDEPSFTRAYHTLSDVLSHHISNYTVQSSLHGLGQASPLTSLSPLMNLVLNLGGKEWDARPEEVIRDISQGRWPTLTRDLAPKTSGVPNQAGSGAPLDSGSTPAHMLSSIFGIAADAWQTANRGVSAYKHGGTAGDIWNTVLDNLGQHFKDQNSMFNNTLWSNQQRIGASTPLEEATNRRLRALQETTTAGSDIRYGGYTRKGGQPLSGMAEQKISDDPVIQRMYFEASRYNTLVTRQETEIKDIRKLKADLGNDPRLNETQRRQQENEYAQQVNDKYYAVAQTIAALNKHLSQIAGKPIDIGDRSIDWSKDHAQFAR